MIKGVNTKNTVVCFVGLGSNLGNPIKQVNGALGELALLPETHLMVCSSLYKSSPIGPSRQPDYVNAVAELETRLSAQDLLIKLQEIEQRHQRSREARWGPRTLDLDLLLYGSDVIHGDNLVVPHPEMHKRNFVLIPLCEIAPQLTIPGRGQITELLQECPDNEISVITKNKKII